MPRTSASREARERPICRVTAKRVRCGAGADRERSGSSRSGSGRAGGSGGNGRLFGGVDLRRQLVQMRGHIASEKSREHGSRDGHVQGFWMAEPAHLVETHAALPVFEEQLDLPGAMRR